VLEVHEALEIVNVDSGYHGIDSKSLGKPDQCRLVKNRNRMIPHQAPVRLILENEQLFHPSV
jgi:hypothetical protein